MAVCQVVKIAVHADLEISHGGTERCDNIDLLLFGGRSGTHVTVTVHAAVAIGGAKGGGSGSGSGEG
eukprot:scaffold3789_cov44-Attheya_sp.AAC.2